MEPTIRAEETVAVALFDTPARVAALERGTLVVYTFPSDTTKQFIKRLVGVPGDTLAMARGVLHLNGQPRQEPYAHYSQTDSATNATRNNWGPLVVPPDSFFVLGDNRDHSADSRYWGFVPARLIFGRVVDPDRRAP
jgi:signal peptidase I